MELAEANHLHNAIALLERTPKVLETLLEGVEEETLTWKPAPGRWSIAEVLSHLADLEAVYSKRAERILGETAPALEKYDPDRAVAPGEHSRKYGEDQLVRFVEARSGTIALLSMMPPTAGTRTGVHSELGAITLTEMLNEWASHDLGHLRQIAEIYRAREFYPQAGPFQKYSNPKP